MFSPREHVLGLAGVLSLLSLGLIVGAAARIIPATVLPRTSTDILTAIPHINVGISLVAILVIASGWRSIRRGNVARHRFSMQVGFVLFGLFLTLYVYKVILAGPATFPGPRVLYTFVYLPVLAIHVLLATVCVPLLYYVLLLGLTHPVRDLPETHHPRIGRITVILWLISFALGIVVYAMLYIIPF